MEKFFREDNIRGEESTHLASLEVNNFAHSTGWRSASMMATRNDTIRERDTGQMGALKVATSGPNKGGERIRIETYLTRLGEDGQGGDRRGRGRKSEAKGIDKNDGATQFGSRAYFERSPNHLPNSSHLFFAEPITQPRRPLYYLLDSFVNIRRHPAVLYV